MLSSFLREPSGSFRSNRKLLYLDLNATTAFGISVFLELKRSYLRDFGCYMSNFRAPETDRETSNEFFFSFLKRSVGYLVAVHRKIIGKIRKVIGRNLGIIITMFWPFMGNMYLNSTFKSFLELIFFRLV